MGLWRDWRVDGLLTLPPYSLPSSLLVQRLQASNTYARAHCMPPLHSLSHSLRPSVRTSKRTQLHSLPHSYALGRRPRRRPGGRSSPITIAQLQGRPSMEGDGTGVAAGRTAAAGRGLRRTREGRKEGRRRDVCRILPLYLFLYLTLFFPFPLPSLP